MLNLSQASLGTQKLRFDPILDHLVSLPAMVNPDLPGELLYCKPPRSPSGDPCQPPGDPSGPTTNTNIMPGDPSGPTEWKYQNV